MKVDIEQQFDFYLEKNNLDKSKMNPIQLIETRRAFYGGFSMFFTKLDEISRLNDDEMLSTMDDIENQLIVFWKMAVLPPTDKSNLN